MNELIKINTRDSGIRTVNARDLHGFLEVKSEFRNWIKNRVDDFGFAEGSDFVTTVEIYRGGERKDYHITLDMAKELAMVERTPKGKEARQYFIECERRLKVAAPHAAPQSLPEALRLAAHLAEQNAQQAKLLEQQKPAVEFVEKYAEVSPLVSPAS